MAPAHEPVVRVEAVSSGWDGVAVTRDVSFAVYPGEVFGILGASGCGKSTLLKHMIGLFPPMAGRVLIHGEDVAETRGATRQRLLTQIGVMYQQGALFGSMTLAENVALPVEEHARLPHAMRMRIAAAKLREVGLGGFEAYYPDEISGGMRKRVAIARAMALDPPLLFLDEPSAGLDPVSSAELDKLILRLAHVLGITFVMVTHEVPSILAIVDRAVMLDKDVQGVAAIGTPRELRARTDHPFLARFFERANQPCDDPAQEQDPAQETP